MHARRAALGAVLAAAVLLASAAPAAAHECFNVSKNAQNPAAGAQVTVGTEGQILDATRGVEERIEQGLIDPDTGAGYHGVIAFDVDGDGVADISTFIVTPNDEIPAQAQESGSPDHGIINICGAVDCGG